MGAERRPTGPEVMSFQPGDSLDGGKYRIVRLLGEGGMGAVYEGENARIHRRVAIKVLHAAIAAKADVVQRFEREAQAAGRIGSEHIVEVLDLGSSPEGDRFMVMEFLEGESLGDRIRRKGRLSPQEVAGVLHQLLAGLGAAHGAGIIHRDLKPDNVFLVHARAGRRDFVKILDFGVSKFASLESDLSMTKTGAVVGTPFYMSPEQARGQEIDARSDLFSVGVVAYQAVTGRVPFNAATFNELVFKIALESPEPADVVAPDLDPAFAAIIARAMVRDPGGRFQTAGEFQAAIAAWAATAGVVVDQGDTIAPAGISGAMRGVSAAELGLAKTVSGDFTAPADGARPARKGRSIAIGAAAVLAMAVGGVAAYWLLGGPPARVAPAATVAAPAPPPAPSVVTTAAPSATATAAPVESAAPTVTATAEPLPAGKRPWPKASAKAVPSAKPSAGAAQTPAARTIGSEL
ncbi:MAG: serine/threonine-protein kinase [Minicystis sp.]